MRILFLLAALLCSAVLPAASQLRLRSSETLPLGRDHSWTMPRWSPDGMKIYVTATDVRGVWEYTVATRTSRVVDADAEGVRRTSTLSGGIKALLDSLGGNGRVIWPSLSPDGGRLAGYDMEQGSFVADLRNGGRVLLGRRDAAVWTRDGRWLIFMRDLDDGHVITGSEIAFVAPDGSQGGTLTSTPGVTEMYPQCSPVENAIVCVTLEGDVVILRYEEDGR